MLLLYMELILKPPNLRTVGVQRVSPEGIDFVMKKGSGTCDSLASGRPLAILHLQGRYLPGETAEQWRGEGSCERLPLDDLMDLLPHYTVAAMVSSKRIENENAMNNSGVRTGLLLAKLHRVKLTQIDEMLAYTNQFFCCECSFLFRIAP